MAYLIVNDYTRLISVAKLSEILTQAAVSTNPPMTTDQVRANAENMAKAEIRSYLNKLYDISAEFAKDYTDATRNENIIRAMIVIAVYNLHFTINPNDIPTMRLTAYNNTRSDLAAARDGLLDFELVDRDDTLTDGMHRTEIGSSAKFISKPFTDPSITQGIV